MYVAFYALYNYCKMKKKYYGYVSKCTEDTDVGVYNTIKINQHLYLIEFVSSQIDIVTGEYDIVELEKKYDEHDRFIGYSFVKFVKKAI